MLLFLINQRPCNRLLYHIVLSFQFLKNLHTCTIKVLNVRKHVKYVQCGIVNIIV